MQPLARRLASIAIVLAAAASIGCGSARETALPAGSRVLIVGDSITAGYGIDSASAWPAQLAQRTGWQVVAAGVSGDRTAGGVERLPPLLEEHSPALVIIELGGNDMLRRVPDAEIAANLQRMIENARARGASVVLMAPPQPTALGAMTGFSAADLYRDVAKRTKVRLIEKAMPAVLSDSKLKIDMLHPTAEGHRLLAEKAAVELEAMGYASKR